MGTRTIGLIALVVGTLALFYSLSLDTTILSNDGDRIYNNGLLNQKTNYLIASCSIMVVGAIFYCIGHLVLMSEQQNDRLLGIIRLLKMDLVNSGQDPSRVDEVIIAGNKKKFE